MRRVLTLCPDTFVSEINNRAFKKGKLKCLSDKNFYNQLAD